MAAKPLQNQIEKFFLGVPFFFGFLVIPWRVSGSDKLLPYCDSTQKMVEKNGLYFTSADVVTLSPAKVFKGLFLVDTGWDDVSLTQRGCQKLGCKLVDAKTRQTSGATVAFEKEAFALNEFYLDAIDPAVEIDGIIGTGILFTKPIVIDFSHHYLCFPKTAVSKIAHDLKMETLSAKYERTGAWVTLNFNSTVVPNILLDSGSDSTSVLPEHISAMGLEKRSDEKRESAYGKYRAAVYDGPILVKTSRPIAQLGRIRTAPNARFQKIGTDVLKGKVVGFDQDAKAVFIGR